MVDFVKFLSVSGFEASAVLDSTSFLIYLIDFNLTPRSSCDEKPPAAFAGNLDDIRDLYKGAGVFFFFLFGF